MNATVGFLTKSLGQLLVGQDSANRHVVVLVAIVAHKAFVNESYRAGFEISARQKVKVFGLKAAKLV